MQQDVVPLAVQLQKVVGNLKRIQLATSLQSVWQCFDTAATNLQQNCNYFILTMF